VLPIELGRLSAGAVSQLLDALLPLAPTLRDELVVAAGGHPELAVQLLTELVQRARLVPGPAGLERRPGDVETLPTDLAALWALRTDRAILPLLADERRALALALASAVGETVAAEPWVEACHAAGLSGPGRVEERLVEARLAVPVPGGWRFARPAVMAAARAIV
jgi:hypothetical protein